MIGLGMAALKVDLAVEPCDMRKGFSAVLTQFCRRRAGCPRSLFWHDLRTLLDGLSSKRRDDGIRF